MKVLNIKIKTSIDSDTVHDRLYRINNTVSVSICTDEGVYRVVAYPGFLTDGRSGGPLVDPIFPNWGTQLERAVVLFHDILYYDFDITWETANLLLRESIKFIGKSSIRANMVYWGVSTDIGRNAFGCKTRHDFDMTNKCNAYWDAK